MKLTRWLSEEEQTNIYSSEYWNDLEIEKKKEFWLFKDNKDKFLGYLQQQQLLVEFDEVKNIIMSLNNTNLAIADLGAGVGWSSALLSKIEKVSEVHSVDISQHRLETIFNSVSVILEAKEKKISRYIGSFYALKFDDNSLDIIFMSQAFHHTDNPIQLLKEMNRVLKPDGKIILMGEHHIGIKSRLRRFTSVLIREKIISFNFNYLFKPDPILGDHYYRITDYQKFFKNIDMDFSYKIIGNNLVSISSYIK